MVHIRFYLTMIILDMLKNKNIERISEFYKTSKGSLAALKKKAVSIF